SSYLRHGLAVSSLLHSVSVPNGGPSLLSVQLDLFYSRKNFKRPELQRTPHRSFQEEAEILNQFFPGKGGRAYCLGSFNGDDCWYLYYFSAASIKRKLMARQNLPSNRSIKSKNENDQTLEVLMTGVDPKKMVNFYKENCPLASEATKYNPSFNVVISIDEIGMIEYWCGPSEDYVTPKCVQFSSKLDTDLFEFVKQKTIPKALAVSPDGCYFATLSTDKKVRIFKFLTGKLSRVYDESIQHITQLQQKQQEIGNMEFGRRYWKKFSLCT
ncbi:Peptidylprolyl isomerase domain and WD repeat-containing protein 1, partial [Armadillidium vulgare]